jgi:hypothetical protein
MLIVTEGWEHSCGNGCCFDYGYLLYLDGVLVDKDFESEAEALTFVLTDVLGHEVFEHENS